MAPYEQDVLTNDSQHSHDISVENVRTSQDDSITKEKYEVEPVIEVVKTMEDLDEDFPDGGLRAWLIVAGVCKSHFHNLSLFMGTLIFFSLRRQCVTHSRRGYQPFIFFKEKKTLDVVWWYHMVPLRFMYRPTCHPDTAYFFFFRGSACII